MKIQNPVVATLLATLLLAPAAFAECEHHDHALHHQHSPLAMTEAVSEQSLFQLDANWRDQNGNEWPLKEFSGKAVIVSMIYASCATACPVLVEDAKRIYNALDAGEKERTSVVFISFDAENDTPDNLKAYAERVRLDAQPWHFAAGSELDTRTLAALLGIRYRKNPAGGYDHSNVVAVLNPAGEVVHRQEGLNNPAKDAVSAIRQALR